jgi:hypothetical protein
MALVLSAGLASGEIARAVDGGAAATLDRIADLAGVVDAVRRLHRAADPPGVRAAARHQGEGA